MASEVDELEELASDGSDMSESEKLDELAPSEPEGGNGESDDDRDSTASECPSSGEDTSDMLEVGDSDTTEELPSAGCPIIINQSICSRGTIHTRSGCMILLGIHTMSGRPLPSSCGNSNFCVI